MNHNDSLKGFTLIELIIYIALSAFVLFVIFGFFYTILQSRVKSNVISEVEQQGEQVMNFITQTVRNAESISLPSVGSSGSTLSVDTYDGSIDPTVFQISSGKIQVTQGGGTAIYLTSSPVTVSSLTFSNNALSGARDIIRIEFTLSHEASGISKEFEYEQTFSASAGLKSR